MREAPASIDTEQNYLGAAILDNAIIDDSTLNPEHFYSEPHRLIWRGMQHLRNRGDGVDLATLVEHLRETGNLNQAKGITYIAGLAETATTGAYAEQHERTILERAQQRSIVRHLGNSVKHAYDLTPPQDIIRDLETFITSMQTRSEFDLELAIASAARYATGEALVKTGFPTLDNAFGGFTRNDLTVIGARTSTGKSATLHAIADNIAKSEGKPVTIFTPDQPIPEILALQASRECRIPLATFRHGFGTPEKREAFLGALHGLREGFLKRVQFRPGLLTLDSFQSESLKAVRSGSCAIIVDTVNRISGVTEKKHHTISEFTTFSKAFAAEFDVPIIALAQMRRELDWEDRWPTRADLADAPGALGNDANLILLLHREHTAGKANIMNVIISKAKADQAGRAVQLFWDAQFATVREVGVNQSTPVLNTQPVTHVGAQA